MMMMMMMMMMKGDSFASVKSTISPATGAMMARTIFLVSSCLTIRTGLAMPNVVG